jgi:maltose alpha-D-glucosyltransferase/alpha-amylase
MVDDEFPGKVLLAEANQWPSDVVQYFGTPEEPEFHMAFHFPLMPRMFMAMRRETRTPIVEIMGQTPEIPDGCQWAIFLRNHDELTLEMVSDAERDYMYYEYAKDPRMRINVGIRRRLAPLLENGRRQIEMMNSLLLSMPGTPVIYYGDEIGMGDNIYLGDRNGVRTPMQWSGDRNAGFSRADWARLYSPVIMDPVHGYMAVNVEAQARLPTSLLHWMKRMIAVRKRYRALGRGNLELLHPENLKVLPYIRRYEAETLLCVVNLSRFVQYVELDLGEFDGWQPVELIGETRFPPIGQLPYFVTLGPHSFYWFRLEPPGAWTV